MADEQQQPASVDVYDISGPEPVLGSIHPDEVHEAVASGKFSLPQGTIQVLSPDGQLGEMDAAEAPEAFKNGFKYASPGVIKQQEYGQQGLIAGIEGVAQGVLGPLAPAAENMLLTVPKEDILGRREANPIASGVGQAVGLGASMLAGVGQGALMSKAGQAAVEAVNLAKPASYAARVGSEAVRQAAEMAVLQSGDEAGKMLLQDPNTSAESALADVGLAAALGGVGGGLFAGAISPLWKATTGKQVQSTLSSLRGKLGGVAEEGGMLSKDLAAKAGIDLAPEFAAKIDGVPFAEGAFNALSKSEGKLAAPKFQEKALKLEDDLYKSAKNALGATEKELDKYAVGRDIGESLASEIESQYKPIMDGYEKFSTKFKTVPVGEIQQREMVDAISRAALDNGWQKAESEASVKLMDNVLRKLPKLENAEDLRLFASNLRKNHPYGSETYDAAKKMAKIVEAGQEFAVESAITRGANSELAAAEIAEYQALKKSYSELKTKLDDLNEHLHVGRYEGPQSFISSLKEMSASNAESVLNKTSGKSKAQILELLAANAPETLAKIKQYHVDKLISETSEKGIDKLLEKIDNLSPQIKALVADPATMEKLGAIKQISDKTLSKGSFSEKVADNIVSKAMTPMALITALMGYGKEALIGQFGLAAAKEGADGLRYGLLKFLGSGQPINSAGFQAMVSFMEAAVKGQAKLAKASSAVFKPGAQVLTASAIPTESDRKKIDKIVVKSQENPQFFNEMIENDQDRGYYLPDHAAALTSASARTIQYLQSIKPQDKKLGPLDSKMPPSAAQIARYNRALNIAQEPLVVLNNVKNGTLQLSDIQDLRSMYPGLYEKMSKDMMNEVVTAQEKGVIIPYATKMGLSLFLQQPMDATMTPEAIMAAQPKPPPQPQSAPGKSIKSLGKSNNLSMTPNQASEVRNIKD